HHPVAEAVVALVLVLADDDQSAFGQQGIVIAGEDARQTVPAVGRIAQAELLRNRSGNATALEVLDRPRRLLQVLAVGAAGFLEHIGQRRLLLALLGGPRAVLGRSVLFRHLHAVLL